MLFLHQHVTCSKSVISFQTSKKPLTLRWGVRCWYASKNIAEMKAVTLLLVLLKVVIFLYCTFGFKKKSFVNESVCYSLYPEDKVTYEDEWFIYSSLWVYKQRCGSHMKPNRTLELLVLLAGDIEYNSGPGVICTGCSNQIKRNQLKGRCQNCKLCFHGKCLKDNFNDSLVCNTYYIQQSNDEQQQQNGNDCYDELRSYTLKKGLKILHQYVNGLLSKISLICALCDIQNKNIHFLGITESKLNSSILDTKIQINGHVGIRENRKSRSGGGVLVYIRDDLNFQRRTDLENQSVEAVWTLLFIKYSKSILIYITYRSPNSSEHLNENFNDAFNNIPTTAAQEDKEIILFGDLNCD